MSSPWGCGTGALGGPVVSGEAHLLPPPSERGLLVCAWCRSLPRRPWPLRLPCASLLQASEEIFQHLQNIVDFSKNVMKEFLGENYVHCGVSDFYLHSHVGCLHTLCVHNTSFSSVAWTFVLPDSPHVPLFWCFSSVLCVSTEQVVFVFSSQQARGPHLLGAPVPATLLARGLQLAEALERDPEASLSPLLLVLPQASWGGEGPPHWACLAKAHVVQWPPPALGWSVLLALSGPSYQQGCLLQTKSGWDAHEGALWQP